MHVFKGEYKSGLHSHAHHFILLQNSVYYSSYNLLSNWTSLLGPFQLGFSMWLGVRPKGTNKTLAPMVLGLSVNT